MLIRLYSVLLLVFVSACASAPKANENANFFLHRWNPGKKAESVPFYEAKVSETEYRQFVKTGKLTGISHSGCFVAVYAPKEGRAIASERIVQPKAMHRVCNNSSDPSN